MVNSLPIKREKGTVALGRAIPVRAAQYAQEDGLVVATRVDMAAMVTTVALQRVAALSEMEARLTQRSPLGAARYQHLVDAFTAVAANQIDNMGATWQVTR